MSSSENASDEKSEPSDVSGIEIDNSALVSYRDTLNWLNIQIGGNVSEEKRRLLLTQLPRLYTPNFSLVAIQGFPWIPRKFSPDGRHCIWFSRDYRQVRIYQFKGVGWAEDFVRTQIFTNADYYERLPFDQFEVIFNQTFELKKTFHVLLEETFLMDVCMFYENNTIILGSRQAILNDPSYVEMHQNTVSFKSPHVDDSVIENLFLYLIRFDGENDSSMDVYVQSAHYIKKIMFPYECPESFCVDMIGSTILFCSLAHQLIHVYHINNKTYEFHFIAVVGGPPPHPECQLFDSTNASRPVPLFRQGVLNTFRQKLLAFFILRFRKLDEDRVDGITNRVAKFGISYEHLLKYHMVSAQFADTRTVIIIKLLIDSYASSVHEEVPESILGPNLFVYFNWADMSIEEVYNNSDEMVAKLEKNYNRYMHHPTRFDISSPQTSEEFAFDVMYPKENRDAEANAGDFSDSFARNTQILSTFPFKPQSFTASPYVDTKLFQYNVTMMSPAGISRPVPHEVLFWDKRSRNLSFKFILQTEQNPVNDQRLMVEYVFHPTCPFVFSIFRISNTYLFDPTMEMPFVGKFNIHLYRPKSN